MQKNETAKAPRFYSFRNYLSLGVHYATAAGLAAASYAFAQPWAIITASALLVPMTAVVIYASKKKFESTLTEHKKSYPFSPNLGKTMENLYKKSGLKSENHPVYDFRGKKESDTDKPSLFDFMKKIPNAAAFSLGKPVIMISEPLLKLLNDEEEKAVLAHEFAHIKSQHIALKLPFSLLTGVAGLSNGLTLLGAVLASGFWKATGVAVAAIATTKVANKLSSNRELLATEDKNLEVKDIYRKKQAQRLLKPFSMAVGFGGLTYLNPLYPALLLTVKGLSMTSKILTGTFSRSAEYQADKGAVALDANPLALISALRKITALMERSRQHAWGNEPVPQPGYLRKSWKEATATHPTLENRIARLADMARKQGYDENTIKQVCKGPVDISEAEDVPYDVLKAMAIAL